MGYRKVPDMDAAERAATVVDLRARLQKLNSDRAAFEVGVAEALKRGLTTRELGASLGVGHATVARWGRSAA